MRIKALLIAPYPGLKELAMKVANEQESLDITVRVGDLEEAIPIAKQFEKEGYDLIISRGGTARLLREHTSLPVIEIQVSGYDILRTLTLIKDYKTGIHLIGFPNICQGFVSVSTLLQMNIPYTIIHSQEEVREAVQQAKLDGARVIIGDTITYKTAEEYGLQGILITSGRESLIEAFNQAKQIYRIIENMVKKVKGYEQLLQKAKEPLVIYDEKGIIQLANASFKKIIPVSGDEDLEGSSVYTYLPFLKHIHKQLNQKTESLETSHIVTISDHIVKVTKGIIELDRENKQHYLKISTQSDDFDATDGISIITTTPAITSFSQILGTSRAIKNVIEQGERVSHQTDPIALYGERGTGKKTLAGVIHSSGAQRDGNFLLVHINRDTQEASEQLKHLINHLDCGTLAIQGIERLRSDTQKHIAAEIESANIQAIFLFNDNPLDLEKKKLLSPELVKQFKPRIIRLPSLKEHMEDLDEYIRIFIAQYNVKFGKQIVGIRDQALNLLYRHHWKRNLSELSDVIKEAVRSAHGEYIETDDLIPLLKTADHAYDQHKFPIDLNKPLAEIEKDIIIRVLKEENMNQTRAARRLGINRSTIWRKLK
ncbi:sigma54 specific transcriptional regulator, Fis family [Caldalkalibacillus thermarum TA2.A1]|uniref:PrpR N-terminal domain-containing protein n=1 Tax=Caldalkalibacillus thermarum (strain TA2.A1) TaxID=986075 RepID=F5L6X1_CALTT|nr:sigma-54-dependent Fis family transcriptional regulator [Caldalkalibacillus thermarum]EGL82906.1 sigma54 specific transcriptional regulator, Fis family [Caldalkalibacillus thermarum TA2.A1]QZT35167.1 PrpR N-terminal domain-containing protein [Caldalkalibacillus thermarum TA2.A1]